MAPTLIRGGRIITAVEDYAADILIDDEQVRIIGKEIPIGTDVQVHDAQGLLVLPGGVDVHTHLDWEFGTARTVDTFGTGGKAAAFGGTTTIVDFADQKRGQSPLAALEDWHKRAESASVDVGAHMALTDVNDQTLEDMKVLMTREGITTFKLFMAYPGVLMVDDATLFRTMQVAGRNGGMVSVHAENGQAIQVLVDEAIARGNTGPKYHMLTRPSLMEGEATHRAIRLAEHAESPVYFVHVSAREAVAEIKEARDRGLPVMAETCPHYLFLSDKEYDRPGFESAKYVLTPPLRSPEHQDELWRGIRTSDLQVISTDHCPFNFEEQPMGLKYSKQQGREGFNRIPNGGPGIETRISLVYDGAVLQRGMSLNRFVDLVATMPAKLFGAFPQKGTIAVGSDADIVLFDPNETWTIAATEHHSQVDYTLFEGYSVVGRVKKVFLRGHLIVDGEKWLGSDGIGRFIPRGEAGKA